MLNLYFTKCFNTRTAPLDEVHHNFPLTDDSFVDLYCDELQIYDLLYGLDVSKSSGPDGISARMLKYTAASIAPSICKIFNLSIRMGRLPEMWKLSLLFRFQKLQILTTSTIIGLFHFCAFSAKFWKNVSTHL